MNKAYQKIKSNKWHILLFVWFIFAPIFYSSVCATNATDFSPADNATDISYGTTLIITFDEIISAGAGNIVIKKTSDNSTINTIAANSIYVDLNGTVATITPTTALAGNTEYYVLIDSNAFKDSLDNYYAGIASTTAWDFTTGEKDTTPWFNGDWAYRIKLTINHNQVNGDLTDFPVYIDLSELDDSFFDNINANGSDLRVTKSDGSTEVPRQIVWVSNSSNAGELYFQATGTLSSTTNGTYYIYYKNLSASEPSASSTYGSQNVWDSSFNGVYHFQESPTCGSASLYDSASTGKTATPYSSTECPSSVTAKIGNGLSYDGGDRVSLSTHVAPTSTWCAWTYLDTNSSTEKTIIGRGGSAYVSLGLKYDDAYDYLIDAGGWTSIGTDAYTVSTWYYSCLVREGNSTTGGYKHYVNGVLKGSANTTTVADATYSLFAGYFSGGNNWIGDMDEIRLSHAIRTANWLKTEYNNINSPSSFFTADSPQYIAPDVFPPFIVSFDPADNYTTVNPAANLEITFSEVMNAQTGDIYIKQVSNGSTVATIDITGGELSGDGTTTITLNPSAALPPETALYVSIGSGLFQDSSGNDYPGFTDNGTWSFTTTPTAPTDWYSGAWSKRIPVTINADYVGGTVDNFPVYVDLSDLPDEFFDEVNSDGSDIRITKVDGITEVAKELVSISTTSNTGELHFVANGTLDNSSDTIFYIYFGNPSATGPAATDTYGANNVWSAAGYIGVWHLTENPGGSAPQMTDSTSYSYDGTSSGSMTSGDSVSGVLGNCLDFDGSNDYIDVSNITQMNSASNLTMSSWMKRRSTSAGVAIEKSTSTSDRWAAFFYSSTLYYVNAKSGNLYGTYSSNDTSWHHIVQVFNGSLSGNARLAGYFDGTAQSLSYTGTQATTTSTLSASLLIGRSTQTSFYTNGYIDEVRVSSKAQSSAWVQTEYNNQSTPNTFYTIGPVINRATPTLLTLSPEDGSSTPDVGDNLVITFDRIMTTETGNITIKKLSDDSTFATISVNSGLVTGNGTSQITINPSSNLSAGTAYYVQVAATAFDDTDSNSYAGFTDNGTWNFTTAYVAPDDWYNASWAKRLKITIEADYVNGDLSNFPVYVDLSDMPSTFFDNSLTNGADLRVTKSDGITEVAREVVFLNTTNDTGELYFVANGTLSGSTDTDFYIYFGNPTASEPSASSTYGKNKVWMDNYLSVWHMHQNPGDSAPQILDSTSYSSHGTSYGSMDVNDVVTGKIGNALDFDGTNDLIYNFSTAPNSYGTISLWYNSDAFGGSDDYIFSHFNDSGSVRLYLYQTTSNTLYGRLAANTATSIGAKTTSTWHYVSMIYGTAAQVTQSKIYVDTSSAVNITNASSTLSTVATNLAIGGNVSASQATKQLYYDGRIDEVRMSSVVRSAQWISTEYNNQTSPDTFYSIDSTLEDRDTVTAISFSPTDNATSLSVDTNLVITFNRKVEVRTGDIVIKKVSGNTIVDTIDITSGQVTGNGTTQITINPSVTLEGNTDYYVTIDPTAIDDTADNSYAGISTNSVWNFTTEATSAAWSNSAWVNRLKITIDSTKVNGDVTDFPIYIDLNDLSSKDFFNNLRSDGGDIRVTQGDGLSLVPIELVSINNTNNQGELWFKAPFLSSSTDTSFYIYYNNPNGTALNAGHDLGRHAVWSNGFVAVYHLNEDPNGDASYAMRNSARNAAHGTPSGSMTTSNKVTGQVGNGIDLDGTDDYINFGDTDLVDFGSGNFEFSVWIKHNNTSNQDHIIGKDSDINGRQFEFRTDGSGGVRLSYWKSGPTWVYKDQASMLTDTNWHHVVGLRRGNSFEIYKDGSLAGSGTDGGTVHGTMQSADAPLMLGRREYSGFTEELYGRLDEVRISTIAHNDDWIKTEYNNQSSPSTFYTVGATVDNVTDNSEPKISSTYPKNRDDRFPLRANLVITFDQNIQAGSGNITIKESNGSTFETIAIGSTTISGNNVTINPSGNLTADTVYYTLIDDGAIEDTDSNPFAGISQQYGWTFRTEGGKSTTINPNNLFESGF